ncbi:hypothetical protein GOB02_17855 [Sinorhizobium meliloti]|nr:hypothetical protein [Sinorhizobium meliloti]
MRRLFHHRGEAAAPCKDNAAATAPRRATRGGAHMKTWTVTFTDHSERGCR